MSRGLSGYRARLDHGTRGPKLCQVRCHGEPGGALPRVHMLRGLLSSRRMLLPGANTCVVENPQNGEPKVGPSPRQPGPWAIPSRKEGGAHPGMYHWPPPITAVHGLTPPQRLMVRPSGAFHPERGDPPGTEPAGQASLRSPRSTTACLSLSPTCNGQALLNNQHSVSTQVTPGAVTIQGKGRGTHSEAFRILPVIACHAELL